MHNHAAALSGFKSKEFGAHGRFAGHNQLVFDDTDNQQRAALHSTQYASQLNLGHLIHQADNYR
ncbi:MAG TPA: type VI secretion system Vgr family protein, partial [Denitromonas sp.]|nr:type VI secretion system Vgr family protein [Denitromonas sp.]